MTALIGAERDRGSQAPAGVGAETAGIPGATLTFLPTGNYALICDAHNPPDPNEVAALLVEFIPTDWVCYDETAEEDYDTAYYGPDDWSPDDRAAPSPRPAA